MKRAGLKKRAELYQKNETEPHLWSRNWTLRAYRAKNVQAVQDWPLIRASTADAGQAATSPNREESQGQRYACA